MLQIDKTTHWVKDVNRYENNTPKTQILIASSLRKGDNGIKRYKVKEFGKTKQWNTFTITRDGVIYQHYDPNKHTDFIGIKKGDKQIISIVLENMGYLVKSKDCKYINWLCEVCEDDKVVNKSWMGYENWEEISDKQFNACVELCNYLTEDFGIRKKIIEFQHYHKDIHKFRGIVFRSNYINESSDISPLININELKSLIEEKSEE